MIKDDNNGNVVLIVIGIITMTTKRIETSTIKEIVLEEILKGKLVC